MAVGESSDTPEIPGPPAPTALTAPFASRSFVAVLRILLLLLAAGAVATAALLGQGHDRTIADSEARYACPMHPEVSAAEPGQCPICGMALGPVRPRPGSMTHPSMADTQMIGMGDLRAVENERRHDVVDFVRKRSLLLDQRELRGPAWVQDDGVITGVFYNDQIDALAADEPGSFSLTQTPKVRVAVRRAADPAVAWDRSTSRIRFQLVAVGAKPAERPIHPGQVGWVELARKPREVLAVPASAVLQSPGGPYVLALAEGFKFEKRPIEIGETFAGLGVAAVLSGLRAQDIVVSRAAFFLDAERRSSAQSGQASGFVP